MAPYRDSEYKPGMCAEELYDSYVTFGEDPWIEGHSPTRTFRCAVKFEAKAAR
jgi:hypothetical protein